ncbi:MAG TPA: PH domain-containing protein, partial [Candidatus Paceibacterota bacterium]|nr:PH domain-containing protein [Candidatus Paceibacterota bacterium]
MPSETPVAEPQYEYLGKRTLWLFIANRARVAAGAFFLSLLFLGLLYVGLPAQSVAFGSVSLNLTGAAEYAALACFLVFIVAFLIALLVGWLVYKNYRFLLGEDALKIKRGVLSKEEIAIPFRQIQDATIERSLAYQLWGLSKLVILTAGREDKGEENDESEGILPALDKNLAERLQQELLRRANIEKT